MNGIWAAMMEIFHCMIKLYTGQTQLQRQTSQPYQTITEEPPNAIYDDNHNDDEPHVYIWYCDDDDGPP